MPLLEEGCGTRLCSERVVCRLGANTLVVPQVSPSGFHSRRVSGTPPVTGIRTKSREVSQPKGMAKLLSSPALLLGSAHEEELPGGMVTCRVITTGSSYLLSTSGFQSFSR